MPGASAGLCFCNIILNYPLCAVYKIFYTEFNITLEFVAEHKNHVLYVYKNE